jgi:site-specific DNA-adenine methylase
MFYYFGRKARLAPRYPAPKFDMVIEPFAGSAAYSLYHKPKDALLIEKDVEVVELWNRLCGMTETELAQSNLPPDGSQTSDPWHLAALATKDGLRYPATVRPWFRKSFDWSRNIAVKNGRIARGYQYIQGDYWDAPDLEATWFIDPPYQKVAKGYRFGADQIDFKRLAEWCKNRRGQVIVCEQEGADWLPFKSLVTHSSINNKPTNEVVWIKDCEDG